MGGENMSMVAADVQLDADSSVAARRAVFLAARAVSKTDGEAATLAGIEPETVSRWKRDPVFRAAYRQTFDSAVEDARAEVRASVHQAADVLREGLAATYGDGSPDWTTRRDCAKSLLRGIGVLTERQDVTHHGSLDLERMPDHLLVGLVAWLDATQRQGGGSD
jgi:hypothetical protein